MNITLRTRLLWTQLRPMITDDNNCAYVNHVVQCSVNCQFNFFKSKSSSPFRVSLSIHVFRIVAAVAAAALTTTTTTIFCLKGQRGRRRVDAKIGADLQCRCARPNRSACGSSSGVRRSAAVSAHPRGRRGRERRDGPCRAVGAATGVTRIGTTCSRRRIATVQSPPLTQHNKFTN